MKIHVFRLTRGTDLRLGMEKYCADHSIVSGVVVTVVGSVTRARLRLADGETIREFNNEYEIVSLTGTISRDGPHMHISLSDLDGAVIGGHMAEGCIVNTTAEIAIMDISDEYALSREFDEETGYDELVVRHG